MSCDLDICSSCANGTKSEERGELSVQSAVTKLTSCVKFYFSNIAVIFTVVSPSINRMHGEGKVAKKIGRNQVTQR